MLWNPIPQTVCLIFGQILLFIGLLHHWEMFPNILHTLFLVLFPWDTQNKPNFPDAINTLCFWSEKSITLVHTGYLWKHVLASKFGLTCFLFCFVLNKGHATSPSRTNAVVYFVPRMGILFYNGIWVPVGRRIHHRIPILLLSIYWKLRPRFCQ
jgi:hypothetical protein